MKKHRYIEIAIELEKIEDELKILDPTNPFERKRLSFLMSQLDMLQLKIKIYDKEGRLSKFTLIKGGLSCLF